MLEAIVVKVVQLPVRKIGRNHDRLVFAYISTLNILRCLPLAANSRKRSKEKKREFDEKYEN